MTFTSRRGQNDQKYRLSRLSYGLANVTSPQGWPLYVHFVSFAADTADTGGDLGWP